MIDKAQLQMAILGCIVVRTSKRMKSDPGACNRLINQCHQMQAEVINNNLVDRKTADTFYTFLNVACSDLERLFSQRGQGLSVCL